MLCWDHKEKRVERGTEAPTTNEEKDNIMSKKCVVFEKWINDRAKEKYIKMGKKGTGKKVYSVEFWPDSYQSCSAADDYIYDYIKKHDLERVFEEED